MVLSRITLDLTDPQARRDLGSPYEMHATIARLTEGIPGRPLWRLDVGPRHDDAVILLQTDRAPDPSRLDERTPTYHHSFESRPHRLLDRLTAGDALRFRVRANPTVTRNGSRHGLTREEEQLAWIHRTLERYGATAIDASVAEQRKYIMRPARHPKPITIHGVTFDGSFAITEPERIRELIRNGIGHAKSLGFGLVTIAR
jgi:CRISPR system Cascade subunit CasE